MHAEPVPEEQYADDADRATLAALRAGDEAAFADLVRRYHPMMVRVARMHVSTQAAAEEVVQDAWLGVLKGLQTFQGRSSLKTWIFRVLVNQAITRGVRDKRSTPFSSLGNGETDGDGAPAVEPSAFGANGWWNAHPGAWSGLPDERLFAKETVSAVRDAIAELPARQRDVIVLRDLVGLEGDEVAEALGVSVGNQRVLLHRARSAVRATLGTELGVSA